jgi:peroxiredoxin
MALVHTPICDFGWKAKNFSARGTDGETHTLTNIRGTKGTLVVFICNHCPYVRAISNRLSDELKALQKIGIGVIAIMSNDISLSPGDSFENMKNFADAHRFNFPYVIDESQDIARNYDAVCTPDFFGFNADDELQYRGRLDESKMQSVPGAKRELFEAMKLIAETGQGPKEQIASMGCSIKWRSAA